MAKEVEAIEVKLSIGGAEFVGQHIIFLAGQSVNFFDGVATVTPEQAEELRKQGYIE